MHEKLSEQISAMADDELSGTELRFVLRRLATDEGLREEWERVHIIRDALHNELPAQSATGLSQRVMAALDSEPRSRRPRGVRRLGRRLGKPLVGLAVAASVAGLALVGLQHILGPQPLERTPQPSLASLDRPGDDEIVGTHWDQPEMGNRLNAYLVNHSEYTSDTSLQGMRNFVRIAGYDVER